jgi:hypothetical protein
MAEAAIAMPIVVLVLLFAINASTAGYCAMSAANAANYGARIGSVSQKNPEQWARNAAWSSIRQSNAPGVFAVDAKVEEFPGGVVIVSVSWAYPSIMEGLCSLFSNDCPDRFYGTVTSSWKKEGW